MKILLFTDAHFGHDTNYIYERFKGENYINNFWWTKETFLNHLRNLIHTEPIDMIINLWDIIKDISVDDDTQEFTTAINDIKALWITFYNVLWNHDIRFLWRESFCRIIEQEKPYYSVEYKNFCHIFLDGNRPQTGAKEERAKETYIFDTAQIEWFQKVLDQTTLPAIVYSHFPFDLIQDLENTYYFAGRDKTRVFPLNSEIIKEIVTQSGKVCAVFSGHTHFEKTMSDGPVQYMTLGSFSENDGTGKPALQYYIADCDNDRVQNIERRTLS